MPLRRLLRTLLLPLLLLLAQQGALLHELGHYTADAQQDGERQHPSEPCATCLAYAPLASLAGPAAPLLPLLAGLAFAFIAAVAIAAHAAARPALHNRGPPLHR